MKQFKKYALRITALALCALLLAGCWNRRELDELGIVLGFALDKKDDGVQVTAQMVRTFATGAKTGSAQGGGTETPYWNIAGSGETILDSIRDLTHETGRKLFLPHMQVIVISEELARDGILRYLDFFLRDHETRWVVPLFISRGKAGDLFSVDGKMYPIPSTELSQMLREQEYISETYASCLLDFVRMIKSETCAALLPIVEVVEKEVAGTKEKLYRVSGAAFFKKDKMAGTLSPRQTNAVMRVNGSFDYGVMVLPAGDGSVSIEFSSNEPDVKPRWEGQQLIMDVNIETNCTMDSDSSTEDFSKVENLLKLEEEIEKTIKQEIEEAMQVARENSADFFGFGDNLKNYHHSKWLELHKEWAEFFPTIQLNINVTAHIRNIGMITGPLIPNE